MTPSPTDQTDPATLAAAEAQAALGRGDTALARAKFVEAGDTLLRDLAGAYKHSDKALLRFLAATQFYKGGHYQRALEQAKKIEARLLPPNTRDLLPQFLRDVQFRSSPDYQNRMQETCDRLRLAGEYRQILDLLKDHPYVYEPGPLAILRVICCERLGQWRAAAMFSARALAYMPDEIEVFLLPAGYPLWLTTQGRLTEAWEYVGHLASVAPSAITYLIASYVCFFRASAVTGDARMELHREQIRLFDEAWRAYRAMPDARQRDPDLRAYMSLCFAAASLGLMRLGDDERARAVTEEAIAFWPEVHWPWMARGMLTYPSEQAISDFRKAAALPGARYAPFSYLIHDAFHRTKFSEAVSLCQEALARRPSREIQAQLYGWMAVCRDHMGANREEVDSLFRRAMEIDPGNEQVAVNYRLFKETADAAPAVRASQWKTQVMREFAERDLVEYLSERSGAVNRGRDLREIVFPVAT